MRRRRNRWRISFKDAKTDKGVDWSFFFKRYVWDDETTPYFFAVSRLNRAQASSELFAYTLFIGILFFFAAVLTSTARAPSGPSPVMSLYSFSIACSALVLGMTKHPWAALWCATGPAGFLAYLWLGGFPPGLGALDHFVIVALLLLLAWYGLRVIRISRAYPALPEPPEED
jgi:hypothetical protein